MVWKPLAETGFRSSARGATKDVPFVDVAREDAVVAADPAPLHRDKVVPIASVLRAQMPSRRWRGLLVPGRRQSDIRIGDRLLEAISELPVTNFYAAQECNSSIIT